MKEFLLFSSFICITAAFSGYEFVFTSQETVYIDLFETFKRSNFLPVSVNHSDYLDITFPKRNSTSLIDSADYFNDISCVVEDKDLNYLFVVYSQKILVVYDIQNSNFSQVFNFTIPENWNFQKCLEIKYAVTFSLDDSSAFNIKLMLYYIGIDLLPFPVLSFLEGNSSNGFTEVATKKVEHFCRDFPRFSLNESYMLIFCENQIQIHHIFPNYTIAKVKEIRLDEKIHSILEYPCMNDKWNCSEEVKFLLILRNNTITRASFDINRQIISFYQINFTLDLNNEIVIAYYHRETNEFYLLTRKYANEQNLIVLEDNYDYFTQNTFSYDFPCDLSDFKRNRIIFKRTNDFLSITLINKCENISYLNLFKVAETEISLYYQSELNTENLYHYQNNEFFYSNNSNLYKFEVSDSFLLKIQAKSVDQPTRYEIIFSDNQNSNASMFSRILPSDFSGIYILNNESSQNSNNFFENNICLALDFDNLLVNTNFTKIDSIQDRQSQYTLNKMYEKVEEFEIDEKFMQKENSLSVYEKIFEVSAFPFKSDRKFIFIEYNVSGIYLHDCFFNLWSFEDRKKNFNCERQGNSINLGNFTLVKILVTFENITFVLYKNNLSPGKSFIKIEENTTEIDLELEDFMILNERNLKNDETDIFFKDIRGNLHQFHLIMNPFKLENKWESVYDLANKSLMITNLSISHYFLVSIRNDTKISLLAFEKNHKEFLYFSIDFSNEILELHKNFSSENIQNSSLAQYQIYFTSKKNVLILLIDIQIIEEFSFFPYINGEKYDDFLEFPNSFFNFYRALPIPKNFLISVKKLPILSANDKLYILLKDLKNDSYNIYVYDVKKEVTSNTIVGILINDSFDENKLSNLSISIAQFPNSIGRDIIMIKTRDNSYFVSFDGQYVFKVSKNFVPESNFPENEENSSQVSAFHNSITLDVNFSNNFSDKLSLGLPLVQENSFSEEIIVKNDDFIVMPTNNIILTKNLVIGHVFLDKIIELSQDKNTTLISEDFHEIVKLRTVVPINDKEKKLNDVRYFWSFEEGFLAAKNDMLLKLNFVNGRLKVDEIITKDFSDMLFKELLIASADSFCFIFKDKQRKFQYFMKNSNCSFNFLGENNQCNSGFFEGLLDYDAVDILKTTNNLKSNDHAIYFLNIAEEYNALMVYSLKIEAISFEFEYRFNYTFDLNLEKFVKTTLILENDHLVLILNNNHLCVFIVNYAGKKVKFSENFNLDSDTDQKILNFEVLLLNQTNNESFISFNYLLIINYQFSSAREHFLKITKINDVYFITPQNNLFRRFLHFPGCEYSRKGFHAFIKNNQTIVLRQCINFDKEAILLYKSNNSDYQTEIDYYAQGSSSFFYRNEIQNIIINDTFLFIFTKDNLYVYEVFTEETYFKFPDFKENLILRRMNFYDFVDFRINCSNAPAAEKSSNGYVWILMMCLIGLIAFITFIIISYCLFIRRKYYKEKKHFFLSHGDLALNHKEKSKIIGDSSEEKKEEETY